MSELAAKQIPWPRILIEGVIIVISILLAFAIEAWWNDRLSRADERGVLVQLNAGLAETDPVLEEWQANHAGVVESATVLLSNIGPMGTNSLTPEEISELIVTIFGRYTLDPPDSQITSLESSGRLGLISNQQILNQLATWRSLVADLQNDEIILVRYVDATILPYISSNASWRSIYAYTPIDTFPEFQTKLGDGLIELMLERDFENHITQIRAFTSGINGNYIVVREALAQLRVTIQEELK